MSYECSHNLLGDREPPPKKEKKKRKQDVGASGYIRHIYISLFVSRQE